MKLYEPKTQQEQALLKIAQTLNDTIIEALEKVEGRVANILIEGLKKAEELVEFELGSEIN